ncbi:hypothetical protein AN189_05795 [Loktanella sp. 3ANDIMAR09]|uniref:hypothetical protein n=1 Tax=Loktanella sp. 3ANDIMAR09 TaxID=1225657 RepID=UPI0006F89F27|nr:hypothetical protein [Loktanella sp. 3ANDIMAR09]KQI69099.1 hypothetical protein AN189_05795 [Loktanella sp. 3ANDIMAR09]
MFRTLMTSVAAAALATPLLAAGHAPLIVSTDAAAGPGSLSEALAQASAATTPATILITTEGDIALDATATYDGAAPLTLIGRGQTLTANGDFTLLAIAQGADVTIHALNFTGPGGFDIANQSTGTPGKGIYVGVPQDATGTVTLTLQDVTVRDVAGHGIHLSDCSLADACGAGAGGGGDGSAASISVMLNGVTVENAGHGSFDSDGVRVDERGDGDITFHASASRFISVGADGVELDEGDAGDVRVTSIDNHYDLNGNYCDPAVVAGFLPDPDEGEFEPGVLAEADAPGPVTGSPDDRCIEREVDLHDDGSVAEYAFGIDLDDGFDVDEAGDGSIIATLTGGQIMNNTDEGLDFDEAGAGDITLTLVGAMAEGNTDDAIKLSEEDAGDVTVVATAITARANGGKGIVLEEADAGDLALTGVDLSTEANDDGDDTGLELVQEDEGAGTATLIRANLTDGMDLDGVTLP